MATVWIPSLMRDLTAGASKVEAAGATVRQVIRSLEAAHPGIAARLLDDEGEDLNPFIEVAVDGEIATLGLLQPVQPESELHIVTAVRGG